MTGGDGFNNAPPLRSKACALMAELVSRELGVSLTADQIDGLFKRRWQRLSDLAHAIHEGVPDGPMTANEAAAGARR